MLAFDNVLSKIKMVKDQIQCQSQSLLNFRGTKYKMCNRRRTLQIVVYNYNINMVDVKSLK